MKTLAVATFARADYSSCLPVLRHLRADGRLRVRVMVGGMHLLAAYGETWRQIEADGFGGNNSILEIK